MSKISRRALLLGAGAAAGGVATHRINPKLPVLDGTTSLKPKANPPFGTLNDASGLSETPVFQHIVINSDPSEDRLASLRKLLSDAKSTGRTVNTSAARHSMGAHAMASDGYNLTLDSSFLEPDTTAQRYRVNAGARWNQVIQALDPIGYGPKVMQSNNDFGVASTFCVNAHGWPFALGPMGSTVQSFRMLMESGEVVECSRHSNTELFNLTMGGYGLFGIIIDLDVEMAPNKNLVPSFETMKGVDFGTRMVAALSDPTIDLAHCPIGDAGHASIGVK